MPPRDPITGRFIAATVPRYPCLPSLEVLVTMGRVPPQYTSADCPECVLIKESDNA